MFVSAEQCARGSVAMTASIAQRLVFASPSAGGGASPRGQRENSRGEVLPSLEQAGPLRERFYAWRGRSGRRYVCSVFRSDEDRFVAGVTSGVLIGVARDAAGAARPVCVTPARAAGGLPVLRECAREAGVSEWHVHFSDCQDVFGDLAASLLH
jgi:hypothetical protein